MKQLILTANDAEGNKIVNDFYHNFLSHKFARKFTEGHVKIELKEYDRG